MGCWRLDEVGDYLSARRWSLRRCNNLFNGGSVDIARRDLNGAPRVIDISGNGDDGFQFHRLFSNRGRKAYHMATANDIIKGAFGKTGIYQPEDSIPAESTTQALAALNDYLNGLNTKGAVFPTVALTINANVPIGDEHVRDLKWAMAGELASQWGKSLSPKDAVDSMNADRRFVAAFTVVPRMGLDAGLGRMPSRPWTSATGGSDVT